MKNLTGVPRSSKFYIFKCSHLKLCHEHKVMFNKRSSDLLLLKIMSEKMLN